VNCHDCLSELVNAYAELNTVVQDMTMHPTYVERAQVQADRLGAQIARMVMCRGEKQNEMEQRFSAQ